jgi:hypothetical protein
MAQKAANDPAAANLLEKIKDYQFHDNRHTCASNLYIYGAEFKDVREHIGQKIEDDGALHVPGRVVMTRGT